MDSAKFGPDPIMPPYIKERIQAKGEMPNMSELARRLGLNPATLGGYLRGRSKIKVSILIGLARELGCTIDDLVNNVPEFID